LGRISLLLSSSEKIAIKSIKKNEIKNKSYLEQQKGLQSSHEQGHLQPHFLQRLPLLFL
jgi:sensor histidine kinase YesM